MLKRRFRGRGEVTVAGANADDQVGLAGSDIGAWRSGDPNGPEVLWMIEGQRSFAGLRLGNRDAGLFDETCQRLRSSAVDDAAASDDNRSPRRANPLNCTLQNPTLRRRPRNMPDSFLEQICGIIPGFRLDVLWQRQRNSPGLCRRSEYTHSFHHRKHNLLRTVDPVPKTRDRTKCIVYRCVLSKLGLELLENWRHITASENIARQQQYRETVNGGRCGACHHIGRPGSNRGDTSKGAQTVASLGKTRGD